MATAEFDHRMLQYVVGEHIRIASEIVVAEKRNVYVIAESEAFANPIERSIKLAGKDYRFVEKDGRLAALSVGAQLALREKGSAVAFARYRQLVQPAHRLYADEVGLYLKPSTYLCPGNEQQHDMEFCSARARFICNNCGYF